jgi:putative ABC transport system ATP-binding protein
MMTAPTMNGDALEISDLIVEYTSGGYAVRPINQMNARVATGELVLLLGASGCGKTTLLAVLAAILTPTSGTVRLGDLEITGLRRSALTKYRRKTVGVVFQAFNLLPSLSAVENVMLPMRAAGTPARAARARAIELLDEVGLGERLAHKPGGMSGGQQQRVAIARALVHEPVLVLADEPTAHLDYIQVDGVIRLLRELAQPGRIVVVATHDERMVPLADRVIELSPHAAADSGPPETIEVHAGGVLFAQGDPGDRVYVVEDGEIELFRVRVDGTEELLALATKGDYFGELAPIFGLQRAATARARTDAAVTAYSMRDFRTVVHPGSITDLITKDAGTRATRSEIPSPQ